MINWLILSGILLATLSSSLGSVDLLSEIQAALAGHEDVSYVLDYLKLSQEQLAKDLPSGNSLLFIEYFFLFLLSYLLSCHVKFILLIAQEMERRTRFSLRTTMPLYFRFRRMWSIRLSSIRNSATRFCWPTSSGRTFQTLFFAVNS